VRIETRNTGVLGDALRMPRESADGERPGHRRIEVSAWGAELGSVLVKEWGGRLRIYGAACVVRVEILAFEGRQVAWLEAPRYRRE